MPSDLFSTQKRKKGTSTDESPQKSSAVLEKRHRGTEAQRLKKRSLRSASRFAFRETEGARRGRACDLLAASRAGHRGKTRAPSKLRNLHGGPRETNELPELFSLGGRSNLAATLPPSWHERTSPRTLVFLCASVPLWPVFLVPTNDFRGNSSGTNTFFPNRMNREKRYLFSLCDFAFCFSLDR